ncbi:CALCIUM BINDING PROTEIN [Salix purpurea]|uniref:CALCIUM BINDING PROTEIN n=1 Tax=Salix purpurea TaxID=77065 RepID=A0A9Q0TXE3_SALPP|nr:CALCIUM BINDING PROTEIN [Salix purpurea]
MSINRSVENMAKGGMSMEEFKAWVRENIDADEDGKITKDELADIIRRNGEWFAGWKARKWMRSADSNRNGVVDEIEIGNLAEFVQKHFGIKIIS